jgi:hypothetical protein
MRSVSNFVVISVVAVLGAACSDSGSSAGAGGNGSGGGTGTLSGPGSTGSGILDCGGCPGNQTCDPNLGCVECQVNGDCADPGNPFCVLGRCEECATTADCGAASACNPASHNCDPKCTTNGDCQNQDATPLCDVPSGTCVGCVTPSDCAPGEPFCVGGLCAECSTNQDCGVASPICDPTRGRCVECIVTSQCGAGFACQDQHCEAKCATNQDCTNGDNPVCDLASGQCVECLINGDCQQQDQPFCSPGNRCVECLTADDCQQGQTCDGFQCKGG